MEDARFVTVGVNNADTTRSKRASDVVMAGDLAFVSGVRAIDLNNDRTPLPEKIEAQVEKIFANLEVMLQAANLQRKNIVMVRVYLFDFNRLFDKFQSAYARCIARCVGLNPLPARTCVGVAQLTRGAQVEMEFVVRTGP